MKTLDNLKTNPKISPYITPLELNRTKWLFFALCFYLLSQSYTIPILPIGPWATWLNLSDFAIGLLVLTFVLNFNQNKPAASSANNQIFLCLMIILLASILSHLNYLTNLTDKNAPGTRLGMYQVYRLVQFVATFAITAQIPLTPERIHVLKQISNFVLIFVCLSILATFAGIVPLGIMTAHLPQDTATAGPWSRFGSETYAKSGWGTIGYNHAYVAVQVMMLAGLRIHLGLGKQVLFDFFLLFLSTVACLISESRAGLLGMIVFTAIYMLKKPAYTGVIITMAVLFFSIAGVASLSTLSSVGADDPLLQRQATLLDSGNKENLSGRDEIWTERIAFLDKHPVRWILGAGFGSAWDYWDSGESAHLLFLHIILENGLIGLLIFCVLFFLIFFFLNRHEAGVKAIYWVTMALMLGAFSQETFYPIPALGHFIGLYLCSVAIALRRNIEVLPAHPTSSFKD